MKRNRRPLAVQSLETRKLMAGDGLGSANLIAEGTPEDPIIFVRDTRGANFTAADFTEDGMTDASDLSLSADATEAVFARYERMKGVLDTMDSGDTDGV